MVLKEYNVYFDPMWAFDNDSSFIDDHSDKELLALYENEEPRNFKPISATNHIEAALIYFEITRTKEIIEDLGVEFFETSHNDPNAWYVIIEIGDQPIIKIVARKTKIWS